MDKIVLNKTKYSTTKHFNLKTLFIHYCVFLN